VDTDARGLCKARWRKVSYSDQLNPGGKKMRITTAPIALLTAEQF
jgi:hypothetical protein